MSARMEFGFSFASPQVQSDRPRDDDAPLKVLVLGNFSGNGSVTGSQPQHALRQRPVIRIDIDRFDEVLQRLAPRVSLADGVSATTNQDFEIRELDDFRPERLLQRLPSVRALMDLRQKLTNSATFSQAAAELRQGLLANALSAQPTVDAPSASPSGPMEDDATLLERLLGQPSPGSSMSGKAPAPISEPLGVHQLIEQAVAPYIVPKADPQQGVYLSAIDKAIGDELRKVLHSPSFQSLEASWRSLQSLVSNIEDDGAIQVHLLDVAYDELLADIPKDDDQLGKWDLFRRLVGDSNQGVGAVPWGVIIGDFTIAARPNDFALLGALAATAERIQTPLITGAASSLLGCPQLSDASDPSGWQPLDAELSDRWQAIRRSSAAAWVGLALPRVLLRMPYGRETDEVEGFAFEEFSPDRCHEAFLWGNPAYLCAELIAQEFAADGWGMQLPLQTDVGDLPAYTYRDDGEVKLQPCAEFALGERAADAMLQRGLMPILSWKDRNAVRFVRFQSIAVPAAPLAGPWS
ncbi:type VI secretion system contractile sheath domain-containing protein [Schlesneria paludicola]|uniref:type VI secretion system contractile sheath domain-containing protein n=1 Tax=Schlesneria paludicola TaxID=360056 RepID=UPI00029B2840|nr:type VI secretion system contractile sheath large subunit [Schlesneria paludicola]